MMEIEEIPNSQTSICIHCCGPTRSSSTNNKFQHSSHSLSNSTYYVTKALSSIFKLNFLKPFDTMDWHQNKEQSTLLCIKCTDVLADLYHLYQDFLQLGQIDSFLSKKLDRLDEIIDCHQRQSVHCDVIRSSKPGVYQAKGQARDSSSISTLTTAIIHQSCQKEVKTSLTRMPENEFTSSTTTTTTTTNEDDNDYNPDWLDVNIEQEDAEYVTPEIQVDADDDVIIIESNDDDEIKFRKETIDGIEVEYYGRKRRKPDLWNSPRTIQSLTSSSSTTRQPTNRPNNTPTTDNKDEDGHHNNSHNKKEYLQARKKLNYLALKAKFPNPCWYCQRKDFETPADCFKHTMEEHFPKMDNGTTEKSSNLTCTRCSKIFYTHSRFDEHMKWCETIPSGVVVSPQKTLQCTVCSKSFLRRDTLKQHMALHKDDRPYACDQCEFRTKSHASLYTHKKYRHASINEGIQCDECDSYCKNEFTFKMHKKKMHTAEGYHKYREKEKIRNAKRRENNTTKAKTAPPSTLCVDCNVDLFTRLGFINHRRTFHGDLMGRQFTCDTCGTSLGTKFGLNEHIKTVHTDARPFICETCGKSFKTICTLKSHVDHTHSEEGRLKYNEKTREKNRRRKLLASQLASKVGGGHSAQIGGESSNSNE